METFSVASFFMLQDKTLVFLEGVKPYNRTKGGISVDLWLLGFFALVSIGIALLFVFLSFWAIEAVRWESFLKEPYSRRARVLRVLLALALAGMLSCFFAQYLIWSWDLRHLFGG